jgi:hypothetical protein
MLSQVRVAFVVARCFQVAHAGQHLIYHNALICHLGLFIAPPIPLIAWNNASHNRTQKAERRRSDAFWGPSLWHC